MENKSETLFKGWSAKISDCPYAKGWTITMPDNQAVIVSDNDNTMGAVVLREVAKQLAGNITASATCPICGVGEPHEHTGEEIAIQRGAVSHPTA